MRIWHKALADLPRSGTLIINEEVIYHTYKKNGEEKSVPLVEDILKKIFVACGNDWAETLQYAKLLEQSGRLLAIEAMVKTYDLGAKRGARPIQQVCRLMISETTFKLTGENLTKLPDNHDWEEQIPGSAHYAKFKTVVSGSRADVTNSFAYGRIYTKVMHTAECRTEDEARAASYCVFYDYSEDAKSDIS